MASRLLKDKDVAGSDSCHTLYMKKNTFHEEWEWPSFEPATQLMKNICPYFISEKDAAIYLVTSLATKV